MLVFQVYEFLVLEGRWLKKQLLPIQYQAIIFDLGCIYKYKDQALIESILQITSSNNTNLGRLLQDYEIGKVSFQELKKVVDQKVNGRLPVTEPEIEQNFSTYRDENFITAVSRLKAEGFKTALLTNIGFKDSTFLQTSTIPANLTRDFDVIVESCRIGVRKPNPRAYEITARKLDLRPEECVYVDFVARNCRGAEISGMKSVQINGNDTKRTVDQLSKLFGLDLF